MRRTRISLTAALLLALPFAHSTRAAVNWGTLSANSEAWFKGAEGQRTIHNVLSWQSALGSWPKNRDTTRSAYAGDPKQISGTFDNGATTGELRFLARAFEATGEPRCREAVLKGLDHILAAQYPTGGWPQFHPPGRQYHRHITFNDGTMVRLLELLREVGNAPGFRFPDAGRRQAARAAFARGLECILKCQIIVDGQPTVWCAQHDEVDLSPRPGRTYELASQSGSESAGILLFLMSLEQPSAEVVRAIEGGVAWFAAAKLTGIRVTNLDGDRVVVPDPNAPPLWARFYDIGSRQPIFCGRDGVKKATLAEIEKERRTGYAWYGNWGEAVARQYAAWRQRRAAGP
jgi:pectate lyase